MEHIIVMVKKENPAEQVILSGVTACDYIYGCLVALTTTNGANPRFETDVWDLYDLTPRKGWQGNSDSIPEGITSLLAPAARKGYQPVDILNAKGMLAGKALSDPETKELHFAFTPETKASGLSGPADSFVAIRNGATVPIIRRADGKWYLTANIPDPKTAWQCAVTLVRQRACEDEEWVDTLYLTLPGDQRPDTTSGMRMEDFIAQKLRGLIAAWLLTPKGIVASEDTCWDFNWGDACMNLPIEFGGARLSGTADEDIPITETIGFSVDQDEHLAMEDAVVDILNPDGTNTGVKGCFDFQQSTLTPLGVAQLEFKEGMMAKAPFGVFGLTLAEDGNYGIQVL